MDAFLAAISVFFLGYLQQMDWYLSYRQKIDLETGFYLYLIIYSLRDPKIAVLFHCFGVALDPFPTGYQSLRWFCQHLFARHKRVSEQLKGPVNSAKSYVTAYDFATARQKCDPSFSYRRLCVSGCSFSVLCLMSV